MDKNQPERPIRLAIFEARGLAIEAWYVAPYVRGQATIGSGSRQTSEVLREAKRESLATSAACECSPTNGETYLVAAAGHACKADNADAVRAAAKVSQPPCLLMSGAFGEQAFLRLQARGAAQAHKHDKSILMNGFHGSCPLVEGVLPTKDS